MKLVLFLNMGGVSKIEECELFLKNMFNDPYILTIKNDFLRKIVAWCIIKARTRAMRKNYEHLGGKSPLNELTQKLCNRLNDECKGVQFDFINNYVPPFADEVLQKYTLTKDDEIILFPLYPHHSQTTVLSSLKSTKRALAKMQIPAKCTQIEIFYTNEEYNDLVISHILKANEDFKKGQKKTLIFSAHSLPVSTIKAGDVYEKHINEHFNSLKKHLKAYFDDIVLSYQSKLGPIKWLTPATSEILANLNNEALIYPLSFCIDCSESVFELEIEYRKIAKYDYKVIACPNHSDEFVRFIKNYLNL